MLIQLLHYPTEIPGKLPQNTKFSEILSSTFSQFGKLLSGVFPFIVGDGKCKICGIVKCEEKLREDLVQGCPSTRIFFPFSCAENSRGWPTWSECKLPSHPSTFFSGKKVPFSSMGDLSKGWVSIDRARGICYFNETQLTLGTRFPTLIFLLLWCVSTLPVYSLTSSQVSHHQHYLWLLHRLCDVNCSQQIVFCEVVLVFFSFSFRPFSCLLVGARVKMKVV